MSDSQIKDIIAKVDKERKFANKTTLDTLSSRLPNKLISRQDEIEQLVRYLLSYKDGQVAPLVSIYGRSGTGKSTLTKYVCNQIPDIKMCFVNLRKAKTVFGGANLILAAMEQPNLKSAQGLNMAIENIQKAILESMDSSKKLFVLVLDEFDVLFYDKRGNPSDFVYKIIEMQSELLAKDCLCMVITISNNVLADYNLDDRIRSRIGNSEIFFRPYNKEEVKDILKQRAKEAFDTPINNKVIEKCAELSHLQHGDARRAVDLLRVAAELAMKDNKKITVSYVNAASERLQKDRTNDVIKTLSYHSKIACLVIAVKTYFHEQEWHKTASLYEKYKTFAEGSVTYRRFSELLVDLNNTGILDSNTSSKGQKGYSSEFKILVQPEIVGQLINKKWWDKNVVEKKKEIDSMPPLNSISRTSPFYPMYKKVLEHSRSNY